MKTKKIRRKSILVIIAIVIVGLTISGGTYAWLTAQLTVNNGVYNVGSHCFSINYSINNVDNTQDITGTMFPSSGPAGGLSGRVGLVTNPSCSLEGTGILKLHINNGTSTKFGTVGEAHCENATTLQTLHEYKTSSACSGHGTWNTTSTVLKYAVYQSSDATGTPLSVGTIKTSDIGSDINIYTNINITSTQQYYYIFLWLDGYLTDNTYTELPFSGYISATATQKQ